MRNYNHHSPADLQDSFRGWVAQHGKWLDIAAQYGATRVTRRGLARCNREMRRIEHAAGKRGIHIHL
jgi:hypothetical protein